MGLSVGLPLKKTHSIGELRGDLVRAGVELALTEDDADLLDTIYLPSKYPLGSVLPAFDPDAQIAQRSLTIADRVIADIAKRLQSP